MQVRLRRLRVENYSSFKDTGWIEFQPGMNLIIGQNNAGKSALLRAFGPNIEDDRHRDEEEYRRERLPRPLISLDIDVDGKSIESAMLRHGGQYHIPTHQQNKSQAIYLEDLIARSEYTFEMSLTANTSTFESRVKTSYGLFPESPEASMIVQPRDGKMKAVNFGQGQNDGVPKAVWQAWSDEMFYFSAQRFAVGRCAFGRQERLNHDASNLAAVLQLLSGEKGDLFSRLVGHVRDVFPTVQNLSITSADGYEVRTWPTASMSDRQLSFSLDKGGTGVSQVVSILVAVMTIPNAVIVVDEISSFLHPAAAKALLRILLTHYDQHQYIVSTHSPEVLSFGSPNTVHLVRRYGYISSVEAVDISKIDELRDVASHLGISTTDVFSADRIIWIEGKTEELCFPYIYEQTRGPLPKGLKIIVIAATGDFGTRLRTRQLVFDIYKRLGQAASPLVQSVMFSFDRETLSESEMSELQSEAGGRLHFLPRRHFECFLIEGQAIAEWICSEVPELAGTIDCLVVELALKKYAGEAQYGAATQWKGDLRDGEWLATVDAAKLIKKVCSDLTEHRLEFSKTTHSLALLKHRMKHDQSALKDLIDYVSIIVDRAAA